MSEIILLIHKTQIKKKNPLFKKVALHFQLLCLGTWLQRKKEKKMLQKSKLLYQAGYQTFRKGVASFKEFELGVLRLCQA